MEWRRSLPLYRTCWRRGLWLCIKSAMSSLPGARIPLDENRAVRGRNHLSLSITSCNLRLSAMIFCSPRPAASATGGEPFRRVRDDTRIHTSSLSVISSLSEPSVFGSLLLPEIDSRTKRAEQSLIIEGLAEKRDGALCQRYFSYLVVGMSRYEDDRDRAVHLAEAALKLNTA